MIVIVTGRQLPDNITEVSEEAIVRRCPDKAGKGITLAMHPEAYLHPKDVVTKTARLIKESLDSGINLVIFTYSEDVVNSIGHMIYYGQLEDCKAVEIDVHHEGGEIQTATYDEEGVLSNWPFGYLLFDGEDIEKVLGKPTRHTT